MYVEWMSKSVGVWWRPNLDSGVSLLVHPIPAFATQREAVSRWDGMSTDRPEFIDETDSGRMFLVCKRVEVGNFSEQIHGFPLAGVVYRTTRVTDTSSPAEFALSSR